jgi:pyridinium-3,5-biscarboxylic acid mononucleotide sulfurtransferase
MHPDSTRNQNNDTIAMAYADALEQVLGSLGSVAVALSGGVDSAVVAAAAHRALKAQAMAFTGDSPSVARAELQIAMETAALIGIRHAVVPTGEFNSPAYVANDGSRCYHCKSTLYDAAITHMTGWGVEWVASGANLDDLGDYRPGLQAAAERKVRHPLVEAGLNKTQVRQLARHYGLPIWDKPASPCLSSRIAPGIQATPERVARVESAEAFLRSLGYPVCRVRVHADELARVELPVHELPGFLNAGHHEALTDKLLALGFRFVTIDLRGFKSGSLNSLIPLGIRSKFQTMQENPPSEVNG